MEEKWKALQNKENTMVVEEAIMMVAVADAEEVKVDTTMVVKAVSMVTTGGNNIMDTTTNNS